MLPLDQPSDIGRGFDRRHSQVFDDRFIEAAQEVDSAAVLKCGG